MTDRNLLDVPATAAYLGVGERMVRRLAFEHRIRFVKVGRHLRFRRTDLDDFIEANTVPAREATPLRPVRGIARGR